MPIYNSFAFHQPTPGTILPDVSDLRRTGPTVQCQLRVDARRASVLQKHGSIVPPGVTGLALFDTGASATAVEVTELQKLDIAPVSSSMVLTPSGAQPQGIYPCGIAFPGATVPSLPRWFVLGADLRRQGILVLIGRDFLANGILSYNGPGATWSFAS